MQKRRGLPAGRSAWYRATVMRRRATLLACLAVGLTCFAIGLAACGGSASETPFPLEPDRATLARPAASGERGARAREDAETDDGEGFEGAEGQPLPAPPTWGAAPQRRR